MSHKRVHCRRRNAVDVTKIPVDPKHFENAHRAKTTNNLPYLFQLDLQVIEIEDDGTWIIEEVPEENE